MINKINKKAVVNERNPHTSSNKSQWQGAQADPKQKQEMAKDKARIFQCLLLYGDITGLLSFSCLHFLNLLIRYGEC
jgi:hypothetical protein